MNRICAGLCLVMVAVGVGCGAKTIDPGTGGKGSGGGLGGSTSGDLATCPSGGPQDQEIMDRVGQPCTTADQTCASNNGCGGCSVTCTNGVWTSTSAELCYSVGGAC
jgi:hypothetical protein